MSGNIYLKQGSHTQTVSSGSSTATGVIKAANGASNLTNSTNLDEYVSAVMSVTFGTGSTEGLTIDLYLIPKLDGTNLGTVDTSGTLPFQYKVGSFAIANTGTSLQYLSLDAIPVMAYDYAPYIVNNAGQTISSGWTLDFYGTQHQYT